MNGQPMKQPEMSGLAGIIQKMQKEQEQAAAQQAMKPQAQGSPESAGVQVAGSLAAQLLQQKAAEERQKQQATLDTNQMVAELQSKAQQAAGKNQQDAFAQLMGNMRNALV